MKLKKVQIIFYTFFAVGCLLSWIGSTSENAVFYFFSIGILIADIIFHIIFHRCPECKRHLRTDFAKHCKHCGAELYVDTNNKDTD